MVVAKILKTSATSLTFSDHAVQHKTTINNQYQSLFEISKTKSKHKSTMKQ